MAVNKKCIYEIQTGGDDDNGGGYIEGSGTTDYSQQTAAQLSAADGATSGTGVTTFTSATGGFTAAMVGNIVHIWDAGAGSNITDGWYEITAHTDTNTVTLDRAPDDGVGGVSGATFRVGGCLATPGILSDIWTTAGSSTSEQCAYVKSGTYTISTTTAGAGGPIVLAGGSFSIKGYGSTREDNGTSPIWSAGAQTSFVMWTTSGGGVADPIYWHNIEFDGNSGSGVTLQDSTRASYYNCTAHHFSATPFEGFVHVRCHSYSNTGNGFGGAISDAHLCVSHDNTALGFDTRYSNYGCIAYSNGSHGFGGGNGTRSLYCHAYDNASSGFELGANQGRHAIGCVAISNGAYGFSAGADCAMLDCYHYNNTSGGVNYGTDPQNHTARFTALTGDPYTDAANDDFTLNNTAGAGAVLRAANLTVDATDYYPYLFGTDGAGGGGMFRRVPVTIGAGR